MNYVIIIFVLFFIFIVIPAMFRHNAYLKQERIKNDREKLYKAKVEKLIDLELQEKLKNKDKAD